ncbi:hypothetical protein FC89_GL000219 [Liquorilactobacillus ghanensis DSM 18630]|uniref:Uncharacterized protein n=1 Tax=Liquorilactobacillus ghanensis DSM 18630 TaxID=1423750 RepID=A0A0R1VZZ2_9LACO|nr:hypothetical protein [Liquorilactobacillus ghanensis]KRM07532.1 hypothetical protein FC89_GL000219 [Liquorilactobacillus ghanensis DSM 18630]
MANKKWYNLAQASEKLGRSRSYVSLWLRRHQNEVPENMILEGGKSKLISDEGIKWIKKHIKKEDVLVSSNSADEDQHLKMTVLGDILSNIHFKGRARGSLGQL